MRFGHEEWELLEKINFVRVSGTSEELKAAELLKKELEEIGCEATIEPFEVLSHQIETAELKSENHTYHVTAYGQCADFEGEAFFAYVQGDDEVSLAKAKGKIVLVYNSYVGYKLYEKLVQAGAVGLISCSGRYYDADDEVYVDERELHQKMIDLKRLPAVHMHVKEAMQLMEEKPKKLYLHTKQNYGTTHSHNVICEIKGTTKADEVIVLTAHYDSVPFSNGVYDNGAGSVILMALAKYFKQHAPSRTLRFIWCGSEERGLLGSQAYVKDHEEELKDVVLNINVDVAGPILGVERIMAMSEMSLVHMVECLAKEKGFAAKITQDTYSSDGISFAEHGIPSITFARFGDNHYSANIHSNLDQLDFMSASSLDNTTEIVLMFMQRLLDSEVFPIKKEIPEEMKKKVEEYLANMK